MGEGSQGSHFESEEIWWMLLVSNEHLQVTCIHWRISQIQIMEQIEGKVATLWSPHFLNFPPYCVKQMVSFCCCIIFSFLFLSLLAFPPVPEKLIYWEITEQSVCVGLGRHSDSVWHYKLISTSFRLVDKCNKLSTVTWVIRIFTSKAGKLVWSSLKSGITPENSSSHCNLVSLSTSGVPALCFHVLCCPLGGIFGSGPDQ